MYRYIHLTIYTYEAHIVYMCLWIQIFVCMCACVCACVRRVCAQSGFGFRDFRIYYICIYVYMDIHMKNIFYTCIYGYTCLATLLANYSAGMCANGVLGLGF